MQTIANPDGTVSIIHVDPNNPVITLPDGTTAQVQGVAQMDPGQGVHTLAEVASQHSSLDVGQATTGELQESGHIIIASDDGQGEILRLFMKPFSLKSWLEYFKAEI